MRTPHRSPSGEAPWFELPCQAQSAASQSSELQSTPRPKTGAATSRPVSSCRNRRSWLRRATNTEMSSRSWVRGCVSTSRTADVSGSAEPSDHERSALVDVRLDLQTAGDVLGGRRRDDAPRVAVLGDDRLAVLRPVELGGDGGAQVRHERVRVALDYAGRPHDGAVGARERGPCRGLERDPLDARHGSRPVPLHCGHHVVPRTCPSGSRIGSVPLPLQCAQST